VNHVKEQSFSREQFSHIDIHYAFQHEGQLHDPDIEVLRQRLTVGKGPSDQRIERLRCDGILCFLRERNERWTVRF
jgi:hypothetical protein